MANSKKILLLSPFFYPEVISTGRFNTVLSKALVELGYDVTLVCSHPLYPKWTPEKSSESISGVRIIRGGELMRYPKHPMLRRAFLELWFAYFAVLNIVKLRGSYEHVISHIPPSLFASLVSCFMSKKVRHTVLVADLQHVYLCGKQGILAKIVRRIVALVEKRVFKKADAVVFMSRSMRDFVAKHLLIEDMNSRVLYPSITINRNSICNMDMNSYFSEERLHVVYSGALSEKQIPHTMLSVFESVSRKFSHVDFHIFSEGEYFDELMKNVSPDVSDNIHFHGLVDECCLEALYQKSSIQIVPQMTGTSDGSMPSKVPNLMSTYTHIFSITDMNSELSDILDSYPLSYCVHSNELEVITDALISYIEIVEKSEAISELEKVRIDKYVEENFSLTSFANGLLAV